MATVLQDLRYGVRVLLKTPGFTAAAVLSLALGIGANTTIFTIINAVLLNPLPVANPSQLVAVYTTDSRNQTGLVGGGYMQTSPLNYRDYRDKNQVFTALAADQFIPLNISGGTGEPRQVFGEIVTGNYFDVLGVRPVTGRTFLPDEDATPGAKLVCVLGYGEWQTRFGGDASLVGRTITLNGNAFTVVGIMPKDFKGTNAIGAPALWVPYMTYPVTTSGIFREFMESRRALAFNLTGRLKAGVTVQQAEANLKTIGRQLEQEYPNDNRGRNVTVVPLAEATINPGFRNNVVAAGGVLMTIVVLVLLIACANVANLMLARASVRQREIAIRLSLGAGRARLIRQLLTEGAVLAVTGGAVGFLLAYWAQGLLWSFRPPFLTADALNIAPDGRVLTFTVVVSLATGVLFGLAPAIQASRPDLVAELKEKSSQPTGSNRPLSLRNLLVAAQIALSLVALVGAGLFLRSLQHAQRIDPGFDAQKLATLSFDLGSQGYTEARGRQFQKSVVEKAAAIPGVEHATLASTIPLFGGGFGRTVFLEGQDASDQRAGRFAQVDIVSPDYLQTMGIRLVRGRTLSETDQPNTPPVVVINETMAKQFWPDQDPIGKRFKFYGQDQYQQVVGVARDSKYNFIGEDPGAYVYQTLTQVYSPAVSLFIRTNRPDAAVGTMRGEVQQLDRNLPLTNVYTLDDILSQSLWAPRMGAMLLAVFAGLSLVLAVIGIYGVMAYSVSLRTREIGIRMALGASRQEVLRLVVLQALRLTSAGLLVGLLLAFGATQLITNLLYSVSATDLVTFVTVPLVLAAAALIASYLPALRATHIDPNVALRYE